MSWRHTMIPAVLLVGLILGGPTGAFTLEQYEFDDPARQAEFRNLIGQVRCLVCQNESLADSQAGLAGDLRDEIYRMMLAGSSRDEVVDFLLARYGDFVLYEPPFRLSTLPLWLGPVLLALIGVLVLRQALASKQSAPEQDLSPEDQARLQQILAPRAEQNQDPRR
ncbi:cytochrome c-type biogenesis protein [Thioalkalicoccus limnaeus]|uniref:Cytochrome c-type biogenesis protein n=1 Tax=Thioalkalicoccus limnaeus TaxID=120681 RepID=A0ABV4BB35_9GAMM